MSKQSLNRLMPVILSLAIVLFTALCLLAFYVPKLKHLWADQDIQLPTWQSWLIYVSDTVCHHGIPLFVFSFMLLVGLLVLRIVLSVQIRREKRRVSS